MSKKSETPLEIMRHSNPYYAMGLACEVLRGQLPYLDYKFGTYCSSLLGQIKREHYLFTRQGDQLLGFAGWALTTREIAERALSEDYIPSYEECLGGDCYLGLTFYAANSAVCRFQFQQLRKMHPDMHVYFRRIYRDRPSLAVRSFNRSKPSA